MISDHPHQGYHVQINPSLNPVNPKIKAHGLIKTSHTCGLVVKDAGLQTCAKLHALNQNKPEKFNTLTATFAFPYLHPISRL